MGCVHDDNGRVRIHHFYNVGQWAKEIKRNPARDEEGIFENNRVTCRFKRPLYVPREETLVDLHLSWYYLFAWGPAIQGEKGCFSISPAIFVSFYPTSVTLLLWQQVPSQGMTSTALRSVTTWSASINTKTSSCLLQLIRPSTLLSAYCSLWLSPSICSWDRHNEAQPITELGKIKEGDEAAIKTHKTVLDMLLTHKYMNMVRAMHLRCIIKEPC